MVMWQWDVEQWTKWQPPRRLRVKVAEKPTFKFKGRLVSRLIGDAQDHGDDVGDH
jgi:hypothetical protein